MTTKYESVFFKGNFKHLEKQQKQNSVIEVNYYLQTCLASCFPFLSSMASCRRSSTSRTMSSSLEIGTGLFISRFLLLEIGTRLFGSRFLLLEMGKRQTSLLLTLKSSYSFNLLTIGRSLQSSSSLRWSRSREIREVSNCKQIKVKCLNSRLFHFFNSISTIR